ncbi:MAG: GNAT family N-acetyltransferase [Acidobacteriales bacterium]|nr:GNAT family N-acetyltransferase [Terriglobales bacterium]
MATYIRFATPSDIPCIVAIAAASPTAAHWSVEQYQSALLERGRVVLLLESASDAVRQVEGVLVARILGPEAEIENLVIAAAAQRKRLASRLLDHFLEFARQQGAVKAFLEVRESNSGARAFYEARGFTPDTLRKSYYRDPPENALLYTLDIK